jgi:hypothetical protein
MPCLICLERRKVVVHGEKPHAQLRRMGHPGLFSLGGNGAGQKRAKHSMGSGA